MAARRTRRRSPGKARHPRSAPKGERPGESPARSLWSGSVSFGLLQIPVSLIPAEQRREEIHFRLLDRHDLSPIKNQRINSESGKPVAWEDIVKGYEYEPGTFVTVDDDELKRANVAATQTIDIQDIVPRADIDPLYFETPYYALPNTRAAKAYVLLRDALRKKDAVAVATFVMRSREHLCALMPVDDALVVEVLRFGHELRQPKDLPEPSSRPASAREVEMAEQLVEQMMSRWQPDKYRDRYHDDVMKMIEHKARTGRVRAVNTKAKGQVASNVVDLTALLRKSLAARARAAPESRGHGQAHARKRA